MDHDNTVVVIEHNLNVVKTAHSIQVFGPEIVAIGTPGQTVKARESWTGRFFGAVLGRDSA